MFNPQASLSSRRETLFTPRSSSSSPPRQKSDMDQFDRQFEESTENTSMLGVPGYAESHASWGSRLPSLSPSSKSAAHLPSPYLSPPSSASPSSTFSANADDFLLNNSFNTADLDMFFQQQDVDMGAMLNGTGQNEGKPGHSMSIPNFSFSPSKPTFDFSFGTAGAAPQQTFQMSSMMYQQPGKQEDNYDLSSFVDIPSTPTHADTRRFSVTSLDGSHGQGSGHAFQHSQQHYPTPTNWGSGSSLNAWTLEQARRSLSVASSAQASQSLSLDDLSSQIAATSGYSPQSTSSWRGVSPPVLHQVPSPDVGHLDAQIKALEAAKMQVQARLAVNAASYTGNPQSTNTSPSMPAAAPSRQVAPIPPRLVAPLPSKRALLPSTSKPAIPAPRGGAAPRRNAPKATGDGAPVGKHNKTEKRYRQKVQAAQTDLRDAVPALRVLYGTSTEEQLMTTDVRAEDGTVDGLGEVTRPNASAKATVLVGARMYIELLQRRVARLERRVGELEEYRRDVGGEPAFIEWNQSIFDRESVIEEALRQAEAERQAAEAEQGDSDDDEEESDQALKGVKRARTSAAPKKTKAVKKEFKGKGGKSAEDDPNFGPGGPAGSSAGGVRVFAAFAMSFSLIPSASTLFRHSADFSSSPSRGHVISRLPLVTAEHSSRILAKALPGTLAPHADSLLDWGWRLIVAIVLGVLIGPLIEKWWFGSILSVLPDEEVEKLQGQHCAGTLGLGSVSGVSSEAAKLFASRLGLPVKEARPSAERLWIRATSDALCQPSATSTMARLQLALRLSRTATSPMSLALLSLVQPSLPFTASAEANWKAARLSTTDNTPVALRGLLELPFLEAKQILEEIKPSSAPIASMANHVTLLHLNDMFSRFFIALVNSSTSQLKRPSVTAMLSNVDKRGLSAQLPPASFKDEMRVLLASVPHGSSARALALVLTGLWSVFNQSATDAQAALASSLAAEQLQGAGSHLRSVTALLQLLWPGSSAPSLTNEIDAASTVDDLAKQTDGLALVCVELVRLLGTSVSLPDANASRADRLEASARVKDATLSLRAMLAQPAFERLTGDVTEEEVEGPTDGDLSDTASESGSSVALQLETVAFAEATERLIEVLTVIGRRAAGRRDGRDQDSGLEGDIDEL